MNQNLAPHFQTWVAEQVKSGHFGSDTEVIEEALRRMERQEARLKALRAAIEDGENSGPAEPWEGAEEIKRKAREYSATKG
jgi:antitoxin ParD1/3/4